MQSDISFSKGRILSLAVTSLFALYVVMLPRYTDIAKTWFALLILAALVYLATHIRQLQQTSSAERAFFAIIIAQFTWIAFTYYLNGEPGQGANFVWGRHFYMLMLIPMFFLFRRFQLSERIIVILLFCSVVTSFSDMAIDLIRGIDHRDQGMNPNGFGPIQLCLTGILFFHFVKLAKSPLKWIALAGSVFGLANVILSLSRNTWITLLVLIVIFAFHLARHKPLGLRIAAAAGVLLLLSSSYLNPIVKTRIDAGIADMRAYFASNDYRDVERQGHIGARIELWKTGWYIFLEHPVSGVGVGGFQVMARANSERYQVNPAVGYYKYAHNQYIIALATRGVPGLILFLAFMSLPIYIAMRSRPVDAGAEAARLSVILLCLAYLIGCLAEDHFETKPAILFVSVFLALLLARISVSHRLTESRAEKNASPQS